MQPFVATFSKYWEAREEEALIVKLTERMAKRRAAKLNAAQG